MAILETISGVAGAASAVAKVGSAFGIGGGKRTSGGIAREQLRMQNRAIKERPDSIRKGAERGGFNPLTYMMASGGGANVGSFDTGATPSAPKLASVGAALQDVGDFFQRQQTVRQNEERLRSSVEADLAYIEAERKAAGGAGPVVQTTLRAPRMQQTASPTSTSEDMGGSPAQGLARSPKARPTINNSGYVTVFDIDGTERKMPKLQADRLKLSNFDMMMMEDREALLGDEAGQMLSAPLIPDAAMQSFGGIFRERTPDERAADFERWDRGIIPGFNSSIEYKTPRLRGDRARSR